MCCVIGSTHGSAAGAMASCAADAGGRRARAGRGTAEIAVGPGIGRDCAVRHHCLGLDFLALRRCVPLGGRTQLAAVGAQARPREIRRRSAAGLGADPDRRALRVGAAPDHPMTVTFPEGEYLKGLMIIKR